MQARAERSLSASVAMVAFLNCDQANSHSLAPLAAMALQYTVERRLGWILKKDNITTDNAEGFTLRTINSG